MSGLAECLAVSVSCCHHVRSYLEWSRFPASGSRTRSHACVWRATPSAAPEPVVEFIGCPISKVLHHVLRPSPTGITRFQRYYEPLRRPKAPGLSLTGFQLVIALTTPWGFPCCVRFRCVHAVATTPAQRLGVLFSLSHPAVSAFPERVVGSACASSFSRLAQRSLALRSAHSRCHQFVTRIPKASASSLPPWLLRLLPAGAVAGWDLHPLESAALSRRTPDADIQRSRRCNLRNCNRSVRAASDQKVRRLESSLISYFHLISGIQQSSGIGHLRAMRGPLRLPHGELFACDRLAASGRTRCRRSVVKSHQGLSAMRFIFGLIVGVALTIGSAAIHDSMEPSPVVNWTTADNLQKTTVNYVLAQFDRLVKWVTAS